MRLGTFAFTTCVAIMSAVAAAQEYSGSTSRPATSVIRPAATGQGWRNYVAVPDGSCGHPMSVEADCYDVCKPCGPLRPICFLHRVGRMLDCFLPCNLCCRGGHGCGLFHGCHLGGRGWGHCNMCCGGGGGVGCGRASGCCPNPCGSAFADVPCTTGGHCYGCSSTVPSLTDPFIDDPLPPIPTAQPAEVRHAAPKKLPPRATQTRTITPPRAASPQPPRTAAAKPVAKSPYKVISDPTRSSATRSTIQTSPSSANAGRGTSSSSSVLRRTSAEEPSSEPAPRNIDHSLTAPIIRSQSPDEVADYAVPRNPLRR